MRSVFAQTFHLTAVVIIRIYQHARNTLAAIVLSYSTPVRYPRDLLTFALVCPSVISIGQ